MQSRKHPATFAYGRLKLIGAGFVLGLVGMVRLLGGIQVLKNWTGQPIFSWGLIAAGGLCILLAITPIAWIRKAADTHRLNAKDRR